MKQCALSALLLFGCETTTMPDAETDTPRTDVAIDTSAPTEDAAPSEAGHDAAPPSDAPAAAGCPAGAYLCEDFEDGSYARGLALDAAESETTLEAVAAHGALALHVHVAPSGGARALLRTTAAFPVAGNSFFGRAYVHFASPAPTTHVGLFAAAGAGTEVRLGLGPALLPNYSTSGAEYGSWAADPPLMPVDRWTCIEWRYEDVPGSDHDRLLYWIDGIEAVDHEIDGSGSEAWTFPTFEHFELGVIVYHAEGTGFDVRYDDVVLAPSRVGCA